MAWQFIVNQTPANGGTHMWNFVSALMLAGWTKPMDGGGTAGALGPGAVTNGTEMNASRAWVRMQAPDGNRELCIQRGSTGVGEYWWIKYSRLSHFTVGGDKETMPTAADETNIWSSATTGTIFMAAAGAFRGHCGADNAAPYGAYFLTIPNGGSAISAGAFIMDPMDSADALDPDPVAFGRYYANNDTPINYWFAANAAVGVGGGRALLGASYNACAVCRIQDQGGTAAPAFDANSSIGTNPFSGKDDVFPLIWARRIGAGAAPHGWKGIGTVMKGAGVIRSPGDTLSVAGVRDYIYLAGMVFPWDGSVPVI